MRYVKFLCLFLTSNSRLHDYAAEKESALFPSESSESISLARKDFKSRGTEVEILPELAVALEEA